MSEAAWQGLVGRGGHRTEQLHLGTYRPQEFDVEVLNQQCLLGLSPAGP